MRPTGAVVRRDRQRGGEHRQRAGALFGRGPAEVAEPQRGRPATVVDGHDDEVVVARRAGRVRPAIRDAAPHVRRVSDRLVEPLLVDVVAVDQPLRRRVARRVGDLDVGDGETVARRRERALDGDDEVKSVGACEVGQRRTRARSRTGAPPRGTCRDRPPAPPGRWRIGTRSSVRAASTRGTEPPSACTAAIDRRSSGGRAAFVRPSKARDRVGGLAGQHERELTQLASVALDGEFLLRAVPRGDVEHAQTPALPGSTARPRPADSWSRSGRAARARPRPAGAASPRSNRARGRCDRRRRERPSGAAPTGTNACAPTGGTQGTASPASSRRSTRARADAVAGVQHPELRGLLREPMRVAGRRVEARSRRGGRVPGLARRGRREEAGKQHVESEQDRPSVGVRHRASRREPGPISASTRPRASTAPTTSGQEEVPSSIADARATAGRAGRSRRPKFDGAPIELGAPPPDEVGRRIGREAARRGGVRDEPIDVVEREGEADRRRGFPCDRREVAERNADLEVVRAGAPAHRCHPDAAQPSVVERGLGAVASDAPMEARVEGHQEDLPVLRAVCVGLRVGRRGRRTGRRRPKEEFDAVTPPPRLPRRKPDVVDHADAEVERVAVDGDMGHGAGVARALPPGSSIGQALFGSVDSNRRVGVVGPLVRPKLAVDGHRARQGPGSTSRFPRSRAVRAGVRPPEDRRDRHREADYGHSNGREPKSEARSGRPPTRRSPGIRRHRRRITGGFFPGSGGIFH